MFAITLQQPLRKLIAESVSQHSNFHVIRQMPTKEDIAALRVQVEDDHGIRSGIDIQDDGWMAMDLLHPRDEVFQYTVHHNLALLKEKLEDLIKTCQMIKGNHTTVVE